MRIAAVPNLTPVLIAFAAMTLVGCSEAMPNAVHSGTDAKRQTEVPQSAETIHDKQVPTAVTPGKPIVILSSEIVDGTARISKIEMDRYTIDFTLHNPSKDKAIELHLGPVMGKWPDGRPQILSDVGVGIGVFENDKWIGGLGNAMRTGPNWNGFIPLEPGKSVNGSFSIEMSARDQQLLNSGARIALRMRSFGTDSQPSRVDGFFHIPVEPIKK